VSSFSDLVISVGGRSLVRRAMFVSDKMSYSPQHTVLKCGRFDIVLGAHAQKYCRFHVLRGDCQAARANRIAKGKSFHATWDYSSVYSVVRSEYSVSFCYSVYFMCVYVCCTTATGISGRLLTTLTEGFSPFFLSCKTNTRV
jgi:hypothetical protein